MQTSPFYEAEVKRQKQQRAWGYGILWVFLSLFIFSLSHFTSRSYPMDTVVPVVLLVIGLWKLYRARYPKHHHYPE